MDSCSQEWSFLSRVGLAELGIAVAGLLQVTVLVDSLQVQASAVMLCVG